MIRTRFMVINGPREMKRGMKSALKAGIEKALDWWHENRLPKHFKRGAAQKYGYAKRTEKYNRAKQRKKHHQQPLVWSKRMQRELERRISFTGSTRQVHGNMFGPRYLYIITEPTKSSGERINKVDEILARTDREERMMMSIIDREVERRMNED